MSQPQKTVAKALTSTSDAPSKGQSAHDECLPVELQQMILNVFRTAFPISTDLQALNKTIQEVKGHLFNRDFAAAFREPPSLDAYAVRWSAARALAYAHILLQPHLEYLFLSRRNGAHDTLADLSTTDSLTNISAPSTDLQQGALHLVTNKVVCIGGGAGAEIIALAAVGRGDRDPMSVLTVDSADWSNPILRLKAALSTPPRLPAYASEATKLRPENQALLQGADQFEVDFLHQDVLSWDREAMRDKFSRTSLCTIMFTLNELFSMSLPKTTTFLLIVTEIMPKGSHLLVVDSPGSYSEIQLGKKSTSSKSESESLKATKKYPMSWLLDHTLLDVAKIGDEPAWKKVASEDSLWFRINERDRARLKYPVNPENMRYQMHIYTRL